MTTEVVPTSHSHIGASGFSRWSVCPGSPRLELVAKAHGRSSSSPYAREGTVAHEVAAHCVERGQDAWEWVCSEIEVEGEAITVTAEMALAVQVWIDTIRADADEYEQDTGDRPTLYVEVKFDLSDIREQMFGTSDIVMLLPKWGMIRVYDYKHGVGIPVDVHRNGQLMYYAIGALHQLGRESSPYEAIELVVVQPRNEHRMGPVRRWRTDYDDLIAWMEDDLLPAVDRTRDPDAPLEPGDHCRFCAAKTFCPALHKLAEEAMDVDSVKPLSDEELAEWMRKRAGLRHFLKALDDETYHRLANGNTVPGHKLVPKRTARTWSDGAQEAIKATLGRQGFRIEPLSPAQVEKLPGGSELVQKYATKAEGGLTLASDTDGRPSVAVKRAADYFDGI